MHWRAPRGAPRRTKRRKHVRRRLKAWHAEWRRVRPIPAHIQRRRWGRLACIVACRTSMGSRSLRRGSRLLDSVSSRVLKLSSSVAVLVDNRLGSSVLGRARPSLLGASGLSRGSGVSVFGLGPHPPLVVILSGLPLHPRAVSGLSGTARVSKVPRIAARLPVCVHWASRVSSNRPHLLALNRCAYVVFRVSDAAEAGVGLVSLGV